MAALLPLFWCSGILINSNFILRMLEWQHENTLFTLRIHGRQWYWIFKYDIRGFNDVFNHNKKIGNNFLLATKRSENLYNTFNNLSMFYNIFLIKNSKFYWQRIEDKSWLSLYLKNKIFYNNNTVDFKHQFNTLIIKINKNFGKNFNNFNNYIKNYIYVKPFISHFKLKYDFKKFIYFKKFFGIEAYDNIWDVKWCVRKVRMSGGLFVRFLKKPNIVFPNIINSNFNKNYDYNMQVEDLYKNISDFNGTNNHINSINLFNVKYFSLFFTNKSSYTEKIVENRPFYILKLLRAKKTVSLSSNSLKLRNNKNMIRNINNTNNTNNTNVHLDSKKIKQELEELKKKKNLFSIKIVKSVSRFNSKKIVSKYFTDEDKFKLEENYLLERYKIKKISKRKNEIFKLALSKRLLKVRRMALIPLYNNITLITSSYDVAHSFFVPSLGLKFDCVPGRSTHHTLNVANKGVYYAQCAEVCGRYHHHMPSRVGAVLFEHFLYWWKIKSMKVLFKMDKFNTLFSNFYLIKYYFKIYN